MTQTRMNCPIQRLCAKCARIWWVLPVNGSANSKEKVWWDAKVAKTVKPASSIVNHKLIFSFVGGKSKCANIQEKYTGMWVVWIDHGWCLRRGMKYQNSSNQRKTSENLLSQFRWRVWAAIPPSDTLARLAPSFAVTSIVLQHWRFVST